MATFNVEAACVAHLCSTAWQVYTQWCKAIFSSNSLRYISSCLSEEHLLNKRSMKLVCLVSSSPLHCEDPPNELENPNFQPVDCEPCHREECWTTCWILGCLFLTFCFLAACFLRPVCTLRWSVLLSWYDGFMSAATISHSASESADNTGKLKWSMNGVSK